MSEETKENLGSYLKRAREIAKLSLADLARESRISEEFLAAIEENRWDELPGDTYARAYLQSITKRLGLDQEKMLAWYLQITNQSGRNPGDNLIRLHEDGNDIADKKSKPKLALYVFLFLLIAILFKIYKQNSDELPISDPALLVLSSESQSSGATLDSNSAITDSVSSQSSYSNSNLPDTSFLSKSSSSSNKPFAITSFRVSTTSDSTWIHFKAKGYKDWARFVRKGRKAFTLSREDTVTIEVEDHTKVFIKANGNKLNPIAKSFKVYDGKVVQ
jgi:cytoskeletal protein RodZ